MIFLKTLLSLGFLNDGKRKNISPRPTNSGRSTIQKQADHMRRLGAMNRDRFVVLKCSNLDINQQNGEDTAIEEKVL